MFKVKNKLNQQVRYKGILFGPNETKLLEEKPYSDKFHVEEAEKAEENKTKVKGGK